MSEAVSPVVGEQANLGDGQEGPIQPIQILEDPSWGATGGEDWAISQQDDLDRG